MTAQRISGGCLCGEVRYTAAPEKLEMDACHCDMCRRWSGGVLMTVPCNDVVVAEKSQLGVYHSSDWAERVFCTRCGTSLFWRLRDEGGGHVAVSFPSIDEPPEMVFAEEIFIDEKPALYAFAGDRRRKTGDQVIAEFKAAQES
jgi:hypothetical protein